jgi:hypothetical protein
MYRRSRLCIVDWTSAGSDPTGRRVVAYCDNCPLALFTVVGCAKVDGYELNG